MFPAQSLAYVIGEGGGGYDGCEQTNPSTSSKTERLPLQSSPSYELGSSQETFKWLPLSYLSKAGIRKGASTCYHFDSLSLILAWLRVTAALSGDDGNSMFEMRSHSIRNQPSVRQNSPAVWSAATAFLFTCHSSAFLFLCFQTLLFSITRSSQRNVRVEPDPQVVWS